MTRVSTLRLKYLKVDEKGFIYNFFKVLLKIIKAPNLHENKKKDFREKSVISIQKQ